MRANTAKNSKQCMKRQPVLTVSPITRTLVMEIVICDVNVYEQVQNSNTSTSMNEQGVAGASNIRPRRFKVTGVHSDFLNSEESRNKLLSIIKDIEKNLEILRWNAELATVWRDMKNAEHDFLKYKNGKLNCDHLKYVFKNKQDILDKKCKRKKRAYKRETSLKLEEINTSDPNNF